MISFLPPDDAPRPPMQEEFKSMCDTIHQTHLQFTEARLTEALIARFGELPPQEEIIAHCMCVIDTENVSHYVWLDTKPKVGEKVDMSNPLVSIAPPKIYTPE